MDILDDTGVSKLSAKVFSKVNYSFNCHSFNDTLEEEGLSDSCHDCPIYNVISCYMIFLSHDKALC